ncbi:hypothetical protein PO037_23590, partial [Bacteroides thetaiotaomicron]|nr:hypothetical protein [Bacteroides thetaiotaomicron]MDC2137600.1 hypothetical protein [Bacteroides thetaiotaomicron]MDC2142240.1 hypothetical protein [Bacteroides thetaiotaomicron]MDC2151526.1 hypothetical protein [Bacteroides thetaiotaomicron]
LSANSVMRGRLDARRTLKSLVADLRLLNKESEWTSLKKQLSSLLFNKESYLYKENRLTLSRLKGGIPQLLLMECLNFQDIKSTGHYIMLK